MNCAGNHEIRFIMPEDDGSHWCAMCELEAARQEIKDLKLELSARECLDHEADIGAQLVNEELKQLHAEIAMFHADYLGLSAALGQAKAERDQARNDANKNFARILALEIELDATKGAK